MDTVRPELSGLYFIIVATTVRIQNVNIVLIQKTVLTQMQRKVSSDLFK